MAKGPARFLQFIFVFFLGVIITFFWLTASPITQNAEKTAVHLEKLTVVLDSMQQTLAEVRESATA